MTKALSRRSRGADDETRDAARAEARRVGRRLDEWLDDPEDEAGDLPAPSGEDDRLEAIARRLARPAGASGEREPPPPRRYRAEPAAPRARVAESDRQTARALSHLAELLQQAQEDERRRHAEEGLAAFSARLERLESRLAEPPRAGETDAGMAKALSGIDRRLSELSQRIDPREPPAAPPPAPPLTPAAAPLAQAPLTPVPAAPAAAAPKTDDPAAAEQRASLAALADQIEAARREAAARADQQLGAMRQVDGLRRELEQMSRAIGDLAPRASVSAIEAALVDLSRRIDSQRDRGVADDMLAPAERIAGELRAVIADLDPSPIVRNLHKDVQTIGRRLDALVAPNEADAATLRRLVADTGEIRTQLAALAARPLPLEKIETRLADLTRRVDSLARAGEGASRSLLAFDVNEIARSIRDIVAEETGAGLDAFNRRLEHLAGRLDEAVAHAGGARFDELGRRLDELDRSLTQRIEATATRKAVGAGALEELLAGLARKIDRALDRGPQAAGFEDISRKIERLETRLPDPAGAIDELGERMKRLESRLADTSGAETIARIEAMLARPAADERLSELVSRIDSVREALAERAGAAGVGPLEDLVRGLDHKIEAALVGGVRSGDLEAIRNQLDDLSLKVDRLEDPGANPRLGAALARGPYQPQFEDIAERLEWMQSAMTERAQNETRVVARQEELARLVEKLADRLNAAAEGAEPEALKALERQIGELSQRLDRANPNGAALAAVETRIGALIEQMEDARAGAARATEEAVRKATQDILREASPVPGALRETVARELSDIRAVQDASAQRTHETLVAVHETLEQVVGRLAMFEDELTEIRGGVKAPPTPSLAAAPRRAGRADATPADFVMAPAGRPGERREPDFSAAPAKERAARPAEAGPMDFIAAARRAAQQAAADAAEAEAADRALSARRAAVPGDDGDDAAPGVRERLAGLAAALQERKRPLLLGLGALVLMFGAWQIATVSISPDLLPHSHSGPGAHVGAHVHGDAAVHGEAETHGDADAADQGAAPPPAAAPSAGSPSAQSPAAAPPPAAEPKAPAAPPPPRMIAPRADAGPLDREPVGSIGAGASATATAMAPETLAIIKARAELGDRSAQYEYASRLFEGRGFPRDQRLAAQWFEKAAAQGLPPAQYRLASMYEKGVGVTRDFARARQLYRAAADVGNARAMHNLAVLYAEGGEEGRPDYPAAAEWFRKGADYGVRDSQYNLAILSARGLGVRQDLVQAYLWFAAAAAQGDADAARKRDDVGARLDSKDFASAKALADGFHAKEPPPAANQVTPPAGGWENAGPGAALPAPLPAPAPSKLPKPKFSSL